MQIETGIGTKGIPRIKVFKIMLAILILGQIIFSISYLLGRDITTFVPRPALTGPSEPQFAFQIYGTFGDGQLLKPMAVTVANERIYISDTGNNRIQVFDPEGKFLFRFGQVGQGEGQFHFPYGIAGDAAGKIYVADLYQGKVSVFSPDGDFLHYFGDDEAQKAIDGPGGIFITEDNQLLLTDINQSKILVFSIEEGKLLQEIGRFGRGVGEFHAPNGVAVDRQGQIWVVDTGNQRLQVFDAAGQFVKVVNGRAEEGGDSVLSNPRGIGIRGGTAFVVSNLTHTVSAFNQKGEEEFKLGGLGSLSTQLNLPNGLHVDSNGFIYITDTTNQRVVVYR